MRFNINTEFPGPLGIADLLKEHAGELWVPAHLDADQARGFPLDHFSRCFIPVAEVKPSSRAE